MPDTADPDRTDAPLVWLPFDVAEIGEVPEGLRFETVDPTEHLPDTVGEVAFYVPPYQRGTAVGDPLGQMTSLRVVQTLTAGVDDIRDAVPDGVTLCNGRGIHDASTAELALTLTLASLRGLPDMVRRQDRGEWHQGSSLQPSLADRRVLVVGHGSIGQAIEARLAPFAVETTRVARTARDGVHSFDELPDLLPRAEVVILVVPLTDETRGLVDAAFLAALPDGALVVNVARGAVVDTDALLAELTSGRLRAALDVTDPEPLPEGHPLWDAPGLLVSPHVGGASTAMWPRVHALLRDQLRRFAAGEDLANVMTGSY